jgi:osmoprotectant transport system ATP-binding protein
MSAIIVEQLRKQFANVPHPAVDDVSFSVEPGSFIVLLGPSGCGKTTLLKMINRLYEPTSGRIIIDGDDVQQLPVTQLRRRIGYAIQQTGLFPHMRIEQNIAVVPRLLGWDRQRIDQRIDELLQLVNLPLSYRTRYPRQLSGGEQQRVGVARALAADPSLILMDEPFGAIDAITRSHLQDELAMIQRKLHKTIMFVTHDVDEALRLADKIMIVRAGKIVQFDTPLQIITKPADSFVAQLVGSDDLLRSLSLLRVADAMNSEQTLPSAHSIAADADLRQAMNLLLQSSSPQLAVHDQAGQQIGQISFADMHKALHQHHEGNYAGTA